MSFYLTFVINLMNLMSLLCEQYILVPFIFILNYFKFINLYQILIFLFGFFLTMIIKIITKRPRPFQANINIKNKQWTKVTGYSFPSGHTYCAFMLYFILLHNNIISNKLIIILPILIGISRIALGVHYLSDVIMGIIIAFLNYHIFI